MVQVEVTCTVVQVIVHTAINPFTDTFAAVHCEADVCIVLTV